MEKNDTEELLLEGSEIKMNEDKCSHEELRKFPSLCEAMQLFEKNYEDNYEDNCKYDDAASAFDVQCLLESVQREIEGNLPLKDQYKISFIIDLIGTFLDYQCNEVDVILYGFNDILSEHIRDEELYKACMYISDKVDSYTYP